MSRIGIWILSVFILSIFIFILIGGRIGAGLNRVLIGKGALLTEWDITLGCLILFFSIILIFLAL